MILSGVGGFPMKRVNIRNMRFQLAVALGILMLAAVCKAQQAPAARVVDLSAADGTKLKATFFSAGKPGPGVLLLHQCNQQRKGWDGLATQLAAAGISVLTLDYRGYGESEGKAPKDHPPAEGAEVLIDNCPGDVNLPYHYTSS